MNICKRILYNCFGCLLVLDFIACAYLSISNNIFMQKKSWRISCRINKKRAFLCHVLFAIRGATVVKEGVKIYLKLSYCTVHILYIYCTLFKYLSTVVATYGEFPWQASIKFLGSHSCGGSLLSSRYTRNRFYAR